LVLASAAFVLRKRLLISFLAGASLAFLSFAVVWRLSPLYTTMLGKDAWALGGGAWIALCPLNLLLAAFLLLAGAKNRVQASR